MRFTSALLADARGSISGATFSRNRGGLYMRKRVAPTNRRTVPQSFVRASLSQSAALWRTITDAQRQQWNTAAEQYQRNNSLGTRVSITGEQLFVLVNTNYNYFAGGAPIVAPVLPVALPVAPSGIGIAPITGPPAHVLGVAVAAPTDANIQYVVQATAPLSAGRTAVSRSQYRIIGGISGAAPGTPASFDDQYVAKFGVVPATGARVFFRSFALDQTSWYASAGIENSYVIP